MLTDGATRNLAGRIEAAAFEAWPAAEVRRMAGWRVRMSSGLSHRSNSVACFGPPPPDLDEAVELVIEAYRARGLPPRIQVTPVSEPSFLADLLDRRGWTREAPTTVMTASAVVVGGGGAGPDVCLTDYFPECLAPVFTAGSASPADAAERLETIARIRAPMAVASVSLRGGEPAAVGFSVAHPPFAGVFGMRTAPTARRQGHAWSILRALAAWARGRGAEQLYLQVEDYNAGARTLYERAGFRAKYGYDFRKLENE